MLKCVFAYLCTIANFRRAAKNNIKLEYDINKTYNYLSKTKNLCKKLKIRCYENLKTRKIQVCFMLKVF